ncbi:predicted GPI-anchored protein 17 [[Candida] jaroonii]|uniref:Predicted GPI-anchored protein 17 n=1 Tax=[Candida] jaroonii TaxID=467808 RepID=A0ACA9Y8W6_9ASCO|nr:predicted GPI-anchored protein 17 [[Candida] jaroonii]
MKFTTFVTSCLTFVSLVNCQIVSPSFTESEADLVERDLNIPSLVSDLLDGFDVADIISNIDFEKIAGWADNLLNENDNVQYLDKILVGLKNTKLLPDAAVYIVTHNSTLELLEKALPTVLKVAGQVNTTSLFVALDRSGLAYSVVAGALTDDTFLPAVLEVAQKLIKSGDIDYQSLLQQAGEFVSDKLGKRELALLEYQTEVEPMQELTKRDNIEDLLTTVFGSIERSGLVMDTLDTLLTNDEFQDATVILIQGALQNIGSFISGVNFSALKPFLTSLNESGLLQNTLQRALNDQGLREALTSDLAALLKKGTIKQTDLVAKEDTQSVLAMYSSMDASSIEVSTTTASSSTTSSSAAPTSEQSSSDDSSASSSTINFLALAIWSLSFGLI